MFVYLCLCALAHGAGALRRLVAALSRWSVPSAGSMTRMVTVASDMLPCASPCACSVHNRSNIGATTEETSNSFFNESDRGPAIVVRSPLFTGVRFCWSVFVPRVSEGLHRQAGDS